MQTFSLPTLINGAADMVHTATLCVANWDRAQISSSLENEVVDIKFALQITGAMI